MFMTPKTHILLKAGTEIDCNPYVPIMYQIDGTWYKINPNAVSTIPPNELQPVTTNSWTYSNPESLATSGIYSTNDLENLRDHIMFPAERPAVLNTIARSLTGQHAERQGLSFTNLFDEGTLEKLAASTWSRLWGWFSGLGTISAGVLGIWIALRCFKFIVDTMLHGYALHRIYGWSIYLIGAIWDAATNVLLHLKRESRDQDIERSLKNAKTAEGKLPEEEPLAQDVSHPRAHEPEKPARHMPEPRCSHEGRQAAQRGVNVQFDLEQVYFTRVE
ncbi:hypothetical protein KM043_018875 [Ampulex compressa]|nr:hypothetical protein KM043_018875 [Ampulex compressa]